MCIYVYIYIYIYIVCILASIQAMAGFPFLHLSAFLPPTLHSCGGSREATPARLELKTDNDLQSGAQPF